ncbi:multidrug efflux SMR transporter [Bacillus sp. JCM 19041]|uniref:DMT family transporter n=1 Tax=Bacillus sp. JCM 19041 TaxID=1460637 RepID=UPI0006D0ECEA
MNRTFNGGILLFLAILFEVISTTNIKLSDGFTNLTNSIVSVVALILAMFFLGKALNHIALSMAYAIWVGVGTAMIYVISIFLFNEPLSFIKIVGLLMIMGGVIALNFLSRESGTHSAEKEASTHT